MTGSRESSTVKMTIPRTLFDFLTEAIDDELDEDDPEVHD